MLRAVDKRAEPFAPPIFIFALHARLQPGREGDSLRYRNLL